eukprot:5983039-Lingulodinium_polyedra.AAC.1
MRPPMGIGSGVKRCVATARYNGAGCPPEQPPQGVASVSGAGVRPVGPPLSASPAPPIAQA